MMMMMMMAKSQITTNFFQNICMTFLEGILWRNYYYYWWHHRHHQWSNFALTNSMEQSPWEANICSSSQAITRFLSDPKVHKRAHSDPQVNSLLSQMNPVQIITLCFFMSILRPSCTHWVYSRKSSSTLLQLLARFRRVRIRIFTRSVYRLQHEHE
jgi:sterol desaturase/sphingolipid hydroxylase (fatty acid hydroxylase superfamily)